MTESSGINSALFKKINKYENELYDFIKNKKIILTDISKIEKKFNEVLEKSIKEIRQSDFETDIKEYLEANFIINFHTMFATKYKLNPNKIAKEFGPWNENLFSLALLKINTFNDLF